MANQPIVHFEITTNNLEETSKFYSEVFGWDINVDNTFNYWMFHSGPQQGGAFVAPQEATPYSVDYKEGQILLYIGSEDIDGDLAKVEKSGGKILVPKSEIPNTGWMAVFSDPTGVRMALYKAMPHQHNN